MSSQNYDVGYQQGRRQMAVRIAAMMLAEIYESGQLDSLQAAQVEALSAKKERAEAVNTLAVMCNKYGSVDWSNNLALSDILTKHLEPFLTAEENRTWVDELPVEVGFYWCRAYGEVNIARVDTDETELIVVMLGNTLPVPLSNKNLTDDLFENFEWLGPIRPPGM